MNYSGIVNVMTFVQADREKQHMEEDLVVNKYITFLSQNVLEEKIIKQQNLYVLK